MGNRISNPTLKNYNQLKLLLSEQEGERGQIKTRLQHVQNEVMGLKQKTQ